jgi:hypothetical protein
MINAAQKLLIQATIYPHVNGLYRMYPMANIWNLRQLERMLSRSSMHISDYFLCTHEYLYCLQIFAENYKHWVYVSTLLAVKEDEISLYQ